MPGPSRQDWVRVAAAGMAAGALTWLPFARPLAPVDAPSPRTGSPRGADQTLIRVADLAALQRAPIFSAAAAPGGGDVAAADLHLFGVVSTPARVAALVGAGNGAAQWITRGSAIGGFTLEEVSPNEAVFTSPSGDALRLRVYAPPAMASGSSRP